MTSQLPTRETTSSPRAAARGARSTAGRARRRPATTPARPAVPPVERANGWVVAVAVVAGAVLFSWLAMNAFLGG
ncbi:hypothetical protein [Cellulosimicrobium cellulans]|uniref:hypothetical protein n=1 Tax=Cellulosimicrobium cellulans TaxID=1710 RepID=UPI00084932D5|nr:hypothetical protein [Cellulosimicrobium cellulans]